MKVRRRYNKETGQVYYTVGYSRVLHREDGPAVIYENGDMYWYRYGKQHRVGGPAEIYSDGEKTWFKNGKIHRDGGPAIIHGNGMLEWVLNGERHREDGPAIITKDGIFYFYLDDNFLFKEEWFQSLSVEQQQKMLFSEYFIN
jgi:hypothetical protein